MTAAPGNRATCLPRAVKPAECVGDGDGVSCNCRAGLIRADDRIEQLRAVRAARSTDRDFYRVLSGLYEATPEGVSYSQVNLGAEGGLHLRGQAESLAMPFLLPERLEAQEAFEQVLLQDAGQVKKAGGSVTEFRIDCRLSRADTE